MWPRVMTLVRMTRKIWLLGVMYEPAGGCINGVGF